MSVRTAPSIPAAPDGERYEPAARAGIGFTALDRGFAAVDDVAAVQQICDSFGRALWHGRAEQGRDGLQFRVVGLARAACRHQPAGSHSGHRGPGRKDDSCRRVAQRQVVGEAAADCLPGGR